MRTVKREITVLVTDDCAAATAVLKGTITQFAGDELRLSDLLLETDSGKTFLVFDQPANTVLIPFEMVHHIKLGGLV